MRVAAKNLVRAVEMIAMVPSRAGIPASEFVKLVKKKDRLRMWLSAEVYGEAKVAVIDAGSDFEFYIDRNLFVPFVLASKDNGSKSDFEFKYNDTELHIKCGRRTAKLKPLKPVTGYTKLDNDGGTALELGGEHRKLLKLATAYATADPTVAHLNCVYLKKGTAVMASNRVSLFTINHKGVPTSVPFPILLLNMCDSELLEGITIASKAVKLHMGVGTVCQALNAKASREFPDKLIQKQVTEAEKLPRKFSVKAANLLEVVRRLENTVSATLKRDIEVDVKGQQGKSYITLSVKVPNQGVFQERVPLLANLKTDVEAKWMLKMLLPLVEYAKDLKKFSIHYSDSSPYLFRAKNIRLLLTRKM